MPQSLSNLLVHLVFSTKDRTPWLADVPLREEMHAYLGGVSAKLECPTVIVGGFTDHVHLLARMSRTITVADWVKELKRVSCLWAHDRHADWREFHWQAGYGAFSVSQSSTDAVVDYIRDQEKHHQKRDFKDEFRQMLRQQGIAWDERYVWD